MQVSSVIIFLDIDECTEQTHNCCKEGGLCLNTKGSFCCTCKAGFTGNGYNCTGTLLTWQHKGGKMNFLKILFNICFCFIFYSLRYRRVC